MGDKYRSIPQPCHLSPMADGILIITTYSVFMGRCNRTAHTLLESLGYTEYKTASLLAETVVDAQIDIVLKLKSQPQAVVIQ